jgi:hypothetical protein
MRRSSSSEAGTNELQRLIIAKGLLERYKQA